MALMEHEVERINDIVSVVVDCLYKDGKGKKILQSLKEIVYLQKKVCCDKSKFQLLQKGYYMKRGKI